MFRLRLAWGAAGGVIASVAKPEQPPSRQTVAGPGSLTLEQLHSGQWAQQESTVGLTHK